MKNLGFASGYVDKSSTDSRHEGLLRDVRERQHRSWCRQSPSLGKSDAKPSFDCLLTTSFASCVVDCVARSMRFNNEDQVVSVRVDTQTLLTMQTVVAYCDWFQLRSHLVVHINTAVRVRRSSINELFCVKWNSTQDNPQTPAARCDSVCFVAVHCGKTDS